MTKPASKTVLWIDPHLEYRSPSMQHLLHAIPQLREAGWKIEAWCLRSDAPPEEVTHTFLPVPKWIGRFELFYFTLIVNLYGWWRILTGRRVSADVVHASCGTYFGADLISVHFVNTVCAAKLLQLGIGSFKAFASLGFAFVGVGVEYLTWWSPSVRRILAVSDSIADEVRNRSPAGKVVEVLPNSYDETRFHPGVRAEYREPMRAQLGFKPEQAVFIFVSQGHHQRKGFWLAVEALCRLRTKGRKEIRFLVVGGTPETVASLREKLQEVAPDWAEWVILTGMQRAVEKYYAAADAFLFPSYFEAFSLAEIEASVCGLPLLLTPHHGSEMSLSDGENGLLLPFDSEEMSVRLELFLTRGAASFTAETGRGLNRRQYADTLVRIYEREAQNH